MAATYDLRRTAVLLVDPYNDFLSEGGKVCRAWSPWPAASVFWTICAP
ncbi:hypothetical protein OH738_03470 [Streptomyces hirsutus]|uniref:Uncharacterized protein n=1 Tax=Streptomyces hirsutus TaxID=35620 RepID=A0ABZ1GZT6_9ACTN|nr:hypothetical protein [Streptomyces hirsutus]WSD10671.1 hypothetical protein OIE73_36540 [Streptomyces hirsutus]WTD15980.1 hypothetical protein OH738_03470 [Streptomyces hirsutus]WTD73315.1 hypothetical protein OHB56_04775 [Streptomyces sp. NBC_01635]